MRTGRTNVVRSRQAMPLARLGVALALLGAVAALGRAAGGAPSTRPGLVITPGAPAASRPITSQSNNPHCPVTLDLIQDYLKRWEVTNLAADAEQKYVRFQLLVQRRTRLNGFIQIKTKRDNVTFDRLYIAFVDLANVPAGHPRLAEVLKVLATLNWQNALGTYSWDETDGEVRLDYTFLASRGLCYADFADLLNRLTLIADADLPTIQRAIWK